MCADGTYLLPFNNNFLFLKPSLKFQSMVLRLHAAVGSGEKVRLAMASKETDVCVCPSHIKAAESESARGRFDVHGVRNQSCSLSWLHRQGVCSRHHRLALGGCWGSGHSTATARTAGRQRCGKRGRGQGRCMPAVE